MSCDFVDDGTGEVCFERPFAHLKVLVRCRKTVGEFPVVEREVWDDCVFPRSEGFDALKPYLFILTELGEDALAAT